MSQLLVRGRPDFLLLTDPDEGYLRVLRERFAREPAVAVEMLSLPDDAAAENLRPCQLDTVVAFNVLEHVEEDMAALRSAAKMLMPGGRVVLLVPAVPSLYGSLDTALGHFRRYTRGTLAAAMEGGGFVVERVDYFNRLGSLGWWFSARVRRQSRIPLGQLRAFDACVPLLRFERFMPLPFGQSLIGVGRLRDRPNPANSSK
jgi:SAM-dependent methyltransferase